MTDTETAAPRPVAASRASASPIPLRKNRASLSADTWAVILIGALGALAAAEAVIAWAVL